MHRHSKRYAGWRCRGRRFRQLPAQPDRGSRSRLPCGSHLIGRFHQASASAGGEGPARQLRRPQPPRPAVRPRRDHLLRLPADQRRLQAERIVQGRGPGRRAAHRSRRHHRRRGRLGSPDRLPAQGHRAAAAQVRGPGRLVRQPAPSGSGCHAGVPPEADAGRRGDRPGLTGCGEKERELRENPRGRRDDVTDEIRPDVV